MAPKTDFIRRFISRGVSWLLLSLAVLAQPSVAFEALQESVQSNEKARAIAVLLQHLDVWGTTASLGPVIADEFADSLSKDNPDLADSVSASFRQALLDVLEADLDDTESMLRQSYVDLYDRNFTGSEIQELVAFYATPTGQKYVRAQKALLNDSAMVLQAWLNGSRERVIVRFEELMAIHSANAQAGLLD